MARPAAEVLLVKEYGDGESTEVLHSQGVWVLAYKGIPCALKERYYAADGEHIKYPRTGYNNEAHCVRLAEKMNKMFDSKHFSCMEVVRYNGEKTLIRRLQTE
jgi:hypothetical protein